MESVLDLPDNVVPGPLPQTRISVRPNGVLTDPAGAPFGQPFAVIAENYQLAGQPLATAPQLGTDRYGFTLWQVDKPLRVSTVRFGLLPNGDIDPAQGLTDAGLITYACGSGSFKLALFVKEPETIRILLDNRVRPAAEVPGDGHLVRHDPDPANICRRQSRLRAVGTPDRAHGHEPVRVPALSGKSI